MPLPMQLRSCSMRSAVQVAPEGTLVFGAGATGAGSRAVGVIGGIAGDESESDGAIDGAIDGIGTASLYCRGRLGRRTGRLSARSGQPRDPKPRSENRCAVFRADPERDAPDATQSFSKPVAAGPPKKSAPPSNYAAFTEPHPASRMANPLLEWRPYAALYRGRFLSLLSENPRRIEASHDSTRLPRVKMPL
jgi:hypothetical protein